MVDRIERTQAEKDETARKLRAWVERERLNPSPVPPDDYVPLPTKKGHLVATMIPKQET